VSIVCTPLSSGPIISPVSEHQNIIRPRRQAGRKRGKNFGVPAKNRWARQNILKTGSHSQFTSEQRERAGIKDNLVRLSVGIEAAEDIIDDLRRAIETAKGK
jgi:hypothetical protein